MSDEKTFEPAGKNDSVISYDVRTAEKLIEAILFAAGYPVTYDKLSMILGMTPGRVMEIVENMRGHYGDDSPHGICLLTLDGAAQLCTKEIFAGQIKEALGIRRGGNLSASSVEVLATVAYNQPVTRAYVDTVRGVDSSYAMNSLVEKGMIEPCGRLDAPGRPIVYRTTRDFLRCFGMSSLDELPEVIPMPGEVLEREHDGIIEREVDGVIETRLSFREDDDGDGGDGVSGQNGQE